MENILKAAVEIWNVFVTAAWGMIAQTPQQISGNSGAWELVTGNLWNIFLAIGSVMLVVFFLIGYLQESLDFKDSFEWKEMLLMYMRLLLIQFVYVMTIVVIPQILVGISGVVERVQGTTSTELTLDAATIVSENLPELSFTGSGIVAGLIGIVLGLFTILAAIICGIILIWACIGRVYKLFVLIPIASLPLSTVAGGKNMGRAAVTWIKEFFIAASEVIVMAISLIVGSKFVAAGFVTSLFQINSGDNEILQVVTGCLSIALSFGLIAGAFKGAEVTLRRLFS